MSDKQEILEDIGLSKNETKVYLVLLKFGSCTATEITKESGVHRSNVYDALDSLVKKGYVAYTKRDDVKCFIAANPENFNNLFREKENALNTILPKLMEHKIKKKDMAVGVYDGYTSLKKLINHFVDNGKDYYTYGVPMQLPDKLKSWIELHHKDRIEKKVPMKLIFTPDAKERAAVVNKLPLTQARYLPEKIDVQVTTEISGDEIMIIHWAERPLIIHIKCEDIADAYRRYFEFLWGISKKP